MKFLSKTVLALSVTKNYNTEYMEKNKNKHIQGRTNRRRPFLCPPIQLVSVNLYTKFEFSMLNSCGDIFDEKYRKKKVQIQGRTNRRSLIFNPTIQLIIVNLYTKYEVSILNGFGDIFNETCYGITDGRTDGTSDRCKPVNLPFFQSGGITTSYYSQQFRPC